MNLLICWWRSYRRIAAAILDSSSSGSGLFSADSFEWIKPFVEPIEHALLNQLLRHAAQGVSPVDDYLPPHIFLMAESVVTSALKSTYDRSSAGSSSATNSIKKESVLMSALAFSIDESAVRGPVQLVLANALKSFDQQLWPVHSPTSFSPIVWSTIFGLCSYPAEAWRLPMEFLTPELIFLCISLREIVRVRMKFCKTNSDLVADSYFTVCFRFLLRKSATF